MSIRYRADIDGLRAVAVTSVVLFHAFPELLPGGFIGVDVFFVISGYLITRILIADNERGAFSIAGFYDRRIRRIFPALATVLAGCLAFGWLSLYPEEYEQLGKHTAGGGLFVSNIVLWTESGYFDTAGELKPLLHLWSLGVEEQFYILFPLYLLLLYRLRLARLKVTAGLALASFAGGVALSHLDPQSAFYLPQTRAWELLAGSLVALGESGPDALPGNASAPLLRRLAKRLSPLLSGSAGATLGFALLASGFALIDRDSVFPGWLAALPVLGTALLIRGGSTAFVNRRLLAAPPLVAIGLISYPLYLWHWPLLAFERILGGEQSNPPARAAAVAVAFLLAAATARLVERRLRFAPSRKTAAALFLFIALLAAAGYNIFQRKGLPFRLKGAQESMQVFEWRSRGLHVSDDCARAYAQLGTLTFCLRNSAATPGVALIGDSHANHLYHGLQAHFAAAGDSFLNIGIGGCHPYYDFELFRQGKAQNCRAGMDAILDFVVRNESIHTVILASEKFPRGTDTIARQRYQAALDRTLEALQRRGKQVIFVLDTPSQAINPKSCLPERLLPLRSPDVSGRCTISLEKFRLDYSPYREAMLEVLQRHPAVRIWDTPEALCDADGCPIARDGRILYRDRGHLSLAGSLYLGEHYRPHPIGTADRPPAPAGR